MASSGTTRNYPEADIYFSPCVEYEVSTINGAQVASWVRPNRQPWIKTRESCEGEVVVPSHRNWNSRIEEKRITSKTLIDFCDPEKRAKLGRSIVDYLRHDMNHEVVHQLRSVAAPVKSCQALGGFHTVGLLSQASKETVDRNNEGTFLSTGQTTDLGLDDTVVTNSIDTPHELRKLVAHTYTNGDRTFVRCSLSINNKEREREPWKFLRPSLHTKEGVIHADSEEDKFWALSREALLRDKD